MFQRNFSLIGHKHDFELEFRSKPNVLSTLLVIVQMISASIVECSFRVSAVPHIYLKSKMRSIFLRYRFLSVRFADPSTKSDNLASCNVFRPKYFNFRPRDEDEEEIFLGISDAIKI